VGERNLDVSKMHGTTIKKNYKLVVTVNIYIHTVLATQTGMFDIKLKRN
jgi:hypothetical protein